MADSDEYNAERIADSLGSYIRLKIKLKGLTAEQLKNSSDYKEFLQVEYGLRGLTLTGEQLMDIGDNAKRMMTEEYVKESSTYQDLKEDLEKLAEEHSTLRDKHWRLVSKLRETLGPIFSLKDLLD